MKGKIDSFLFFIILIIAIAYFFPQLGNQQNKATLDWISSIGISFIFFFYGLKLSIEKIKNGLKNWKLHIVIQLTTFVLFPLIILLFYPFSSSEKYFTIWLSFLFLAALPSTVSTSVVMVSVAKGNIPAAIFNASISGLIGIVITPIWLSFFILKSNTDYSMQTIYIRLLTEILLPVFLGLSLQKYLGKYVQRYLNQINKFDKSIVLLIVYKSFAESFEQKIFSSVGWQYILLIFALSCIFFFLMYFLTGFIAKKIGFNREDSITAQFCGTKKSLIHGTIFSKILIPPSISIGIILLPLMIFHAVQIFIISFVASKKSRE